MPSIGESAIRGFTGGLTSGLQLGMQLDERKAKVDARLKAATAKTAAIALEAEKTRWSQGSDLISKTLGFAKTIKNPETRQNYLNNAFSAGQFAKDEDLQSFVSSIQSMPVEGQDVMGKMAGDINKAIKDGDSDGLADLLFRFEALNEQNEWGMDSFIDDASAALGVARKPKKEPTQKTAINVRLPDGTFVISHDGGRTYLNQEGGTTPVPFGANVVPAGSTQAGIDTARATSEAQARVAEREAVGEPLSKANLEDAARGGTGPFAKLAAGVNAVVGGLGIGNVFTDTVENRQALALVKQVGKSALVNNRRFPIAEQKNVDRLFPNPDAFFRNPDAEASKVPDIRQFAKEGIAFNDSMLATGVSGKLRAELEANTLELNRLLKLIGTGEEQSGGQTQTLTMPDGSTQTFDASGKRIQ
jgi:hypothetical protein